MDISEKVIVQQLEEARSRIAYLKDIDIGIPDSEIEGLQRRIDEASSFLDENRTSIAQNRLSGFNSLFSEIEEKYFSHLTPRQIDNISRSDQRPTMLDYAREVFDDFKELKGFDANSTDPAMVCGFAKLHENQVMVVGHEKGEFHSHFRRGGSALPQGNLKAIQAMQLAERFGIPVISFVDTPGSWPLEEYLPAQRIAQNLEMQYLLRVPHVTVVIGEGGSGGALAIDVSDFRIMLEKSYYSVISVSGGAAIIARDKRHISEDDLDRAAANLHLTARDAHRLGIVHRVIEEPKIGVRKSDKDFFPLVREAIVTALNDIKTGVSPFFLPHPDVQNTWKIKALQVPILLRKRYRRYRRIGIYKTSFADKLKHFIGELYRIKWIHPLFIPFRKSLDGIRKMKVKERTGESLLTAQEQPKELTYEDRWVECPLTEIHGCQDIWVPSLFEEYTGTCPTCGYHFRLTIDNYIGIIADPGSFREFNEGIESINPLEFEGYSAKVRKAKEVTGRKCAMITGYAMINGHHVVMILTDVRFRAGTLGSAEGEKFCRAVKRALRDRKPIVAIHQSGGARIEEGIIALMQMVKTSIAIARYKRAGGYYISIEIYQHSDMVMGRGGVDMVVRRHELKEAITHLLELRKMRGR
jgi:acetyl-CoA carboxylase carboxyl transferase subunit beta